MQLSPKTVAEALEVSEASIKRWCDSGVIPSNKTAGGHRRIALNDLIVLVKEGKLQLIHPEALKLGGAVASKVNFGATRKQCKKMLLEGQKDAFKLELFSLYIKGLKTAQIYDEILAPAFASIGEDWRSKKIETYHERRAVELCKSAIVLLMDAFFSQKTQKHAGATVVFSLEKDIYELPNLMLESLFQEKNWRVQRLGNHLPAKTIEAYIQDHPLQMACLSLSHVEHEASCIEVCKDISETLEKSGAVLVIGGRKVSQSIREAVPKAIFFESMLQLDTLLTSYENVRSLN